MIFGAKLFFFLFSILEKTQPGELMQSLPAVLAFLLTQKVTWFSVLGSKKKPVMLVCIGFCFVFFQLHKSDWEAEPHCWISDKRFWHEALWGNTLVFIQVASAQETHQNATCWHFTTRSQPAAQFATKSPKSVDRVLFFFLDDQTARSPNDVLPGGKSDDHTHPERGQTTLQHLKETLQKYVTPQTTDVDALGARRSHKSHRSPSSVGLWTSLQKNKCCPDVKLF